MARWRLRNAHYLNTIEDGVSGTQWEHTEVSRDGKKARKLFDVPRLLDPADPSDCNYPGDCIVANKFDRAFAKDVIFLGDPTPDMEPLDDEAEAISKSFEAQWAHPIESLPATGGYSQSILAQFEQQIEKLVKNGGGAVSTKGVDDGRISALEAKLTELMDQNAQLLEKLEEKAAAPPVARRA